MIQFHRYRLPHEPTDFGMDVSSLVQSMTRGLATQPWEGLDKVLEMGRKYGPRDRLAAIAARMAFWGYFEWDEIDFMLPGALPANFLLKQEIVGCMGFERANRRYDVDEDEYYLYTGFARECITPGGRAFHGHVSYRPRNSGLFSIIENIVAAAIDAELQGYQLRVDLSGNWWSYDEPFEEIFADVFEFTTGDLPMVLFDDMRDRMLHPMPGIASDIACLKEGWYREINFAINEYVDTGFSAEPDIGTIFMRGGDKLQTETIMPPAGLIWRELNWMSRFVRRRHLLSDDPTIGNMIASGDPTVIDRSNQLEGGYHHLPNRKLSCIPILQNYVAMTESKVNFSCPSANLVNAAQWSRNDTDNWSVANPVYRYLLI
jgi:hypothetical protein